MCKKLISINDLSAGTNKYQILHNISFDINEGEIVCLLGQSGSGKTMTALSILNMLPLNVMQTSGTILYNDKPFDENMRGSFISMIMQSPASCFDSVFTIGAQFKDILTSNNKEYSIDKVCAELEKVELKNPQDILNSYPFQLSGGMLQRVMIAIALSLDSKVIIADEPTSDLDITGQKEIIDLILKLKQENKAVLMITHNLAVAKSCADKIAVMDKGRLVDIFNKNELLSENRHKYTKELIAANNRLYTNKWNIDLGENYAEM